jgi:multidrug efflux system membrane fusion protein
LREVRLGPTVDGRSAVLEGLAVGEQVVLEGLDRLREGSDVTIVSDPPAQPAGGSAPPSPVPPSR